MNCSFKAPFTGLRVEPTIVVFQASLLWSVQPYKTTGTCLSARVIERSTRKEIPITKSAQPSRFAWPDSEALLEWTLKRTTEGFDRVHSGDTQQTAYILTCSTLTDSITITGTHSGNLLFPGCSAGGDSSFWPSFFHFSLFYLAVNMSCTFTFAGLGCFIYLLTHRGAFVY